MRQYKNLLKHIHVNGIDKGDRTGTGTRSIFGERLSFDLSEGFPLLTTKEVNFSAVIKELLWIISGSTNTNDLDSKIWNEWAKIDGSLGPVYGAQWRAREGINAAGMYTKNDQLAELIKGLKENPDSRRHIVDSWNVAQLPDMALPPCHMFFQCYVAEGKLSLMMYQRSADMFLGVPFNIASYALLTHMIAQVCDLVPGRYNHVFGDAHIYNNHVDQVDELLHRDPRKLPELRLDPTIKNIDDFTIDHISLIGYDPHPAIPAPVSV